MGVHLEAWVVWFVAWVGALWSALRYRRMWLAALKREAELRLERAERNAKVANLLSSPRMIPVVFGELAESCGNPDCPEHGEQVRAASAKATVN